MNKKRLNLIFLGFFVVFLIVGSILIKDNVPEEKNERVYTLLKTFIPYELEKRIGGFSIVNKQTGHKEKPLAPNVMKRLSHLEKIWGQKYLELQNTSLTIYNDQKQIIGKIELRDETELNWVMIFFEFKNKVSKDNK